jgi:flavin-dependent dehydrogenase
LSVAARDREFDPRSIERESDEVDVCIVGGGPAGLSAAIRLKQLAAKEDREIRVLLLEKGSEMGTLVSPSSSLRTSFSSSLFTSFSSFRLRCELKALIVRGTYTFWGGDTDGRVGRVISRLEGKST